VNAIIEAISTNVSALPVAAVAAQAVTGQRGTGGFALTLAAAQDLAASSPALSGENESATGMPTGSTAALGANLNLSTVALPQRKTSAGGGISGNTVVPASFPMTASPVQWLAPQTSLSASLVAFASVNDTGVAEATVRASAGTASNISGLNPLVREVISNVGVQSDGLTSNGSYKQPVSQTTSGMVQSPVFSMPAAAVSVAVTANVAAGVEQDNVLQNHVEFGLPVEAIGPSSGMQQPPPRLAIAQPSPSTISPSVAPNITPNVPPQGQSGISQAGSFLWRAAESTSQTSPAVVSAATPSVRRATTFSETDSSSALLTSSGASLQTPKVNVADDGVADPAFQPVLSTATVEPATSAATSPSIPATVFSEPGAAVTLLASSGTNLQTAPENVTDAGVANPLSQVIFPATAAGSTEPRTISPPEMGTGNPVSTIVDTQNAVSSIANLLPGAVASRVGVARAAVEGTAPSVHGARPDAASALAPASSPGPISSNSPAVAEQTPFAVFFSGPGAGTESAASVLPKMILPATSSAIRNNNGTSTATAAAPQSSSLNASAVQNVTPQPGKDAQSGNQSDNPQAAAPLRRDDPGAANSAAVSASPQASSSQTSSFQSSSSQASPSAADAQIATPAVAVMPPLSAQPASADSAPRPDTMPAAAGSAASMAAAAQPVALPGPVQVAQMVSRVGQSEMRIGLNTSAFGSVEVRTVVRASDVGLLIGSEKGDLRGLMTNEMPALTNTLQQQNLRLNSVNFMPGFAYSNNGSGGGADSEQRSFVPHPALASAGSGLPENPGSDAMEVPLAEEFAGAGSSFSILA